MARQALRVHFQGAVADGRWWVVMVAKAKKPNRFPWLFRDKPCRIWREEWGPKAAETVVQFEDDGHIAVVQRKELMRFKARRLKLA